MLTRTFESSTSEYNQSTIYDSPEGFLNKKKFKKKNKFGVSSGILEEEENSSPTNKKSKSRRKQSNGQNDQRFKDEVPHHQQAQQSTYYEDDKGSSKVHNELNSTKFNGGLDIKLDTAFEQNFKNLKDKVNSLPHNPQANQRNMRGFGDEQDSQDNIHMKGMQYIDHDVQGAPIQQDLTFYKQYLQDSTNDVKKQREQFIKNRENLANNTFMKLFQDQNQNQQDKQFKKLEKDRILEDSQDENNTNYNKTSDYSVQLRNINQSQKNYKNSRQNQKDRSHSDNNSIFSGENSNQKYSQIDVFQQSQMPKNLNFNDSQNRAELLPSLNDISVNYNQNKFRNNEQQNQRYVDEILSIGSQKQSVVSGTRSIVRSNISRQQNIIQKYQSNQNQGRSSKNSTINININKQNQSQIQQVALPFILRRKLIKKQTDVHAYIDNIYTLKIPIAKLHNRLQYESQDDEELQMKNIVDNFQVAFSEGKQVQEQIYMKKMRLRHPLLSQISFNAFKKLIERSYLIRPKQNETIYQQGQRGQNLYIILFGAVTLFQYPNERIIQENIGMSYTIGEEILFEDAYDINSNPSQKYYTFETAICSSQECCLLQINKEEFLDIGDCNKNKGGGAGLQKDFDTLVAIFQDIYQEKNQVRIQQQQQ
eukprot:403352198